MNNEQLNVNKNKTNFNNLYKQKIYKTNYNNYNKLVEIADSGWQPVEATTFNLFDAPKPSEAFSDFIAGVIMVFDDINIPEDRLNDVDFEIFTDSSSGIEFVEFGKWLDYRWADNSSFPEYDFGNGFKFPDELLTEASWSIILPDDSTGGIHQVLVTESDYINVLEDPSDPTSNVVEELQETRYYYYRRISDIVSENTISGTAWVEVVDSDGNATSSFENGTTSIVQNIESPETLGASWTNRNVLTTYAYDNKLYSGTLNATLNDLTGARYLDNNRFYYQKNVDPEEDLNNYQCPYSGYYFKNPPPIGDKFEVRSGHEGEYEINPDSASWYEFQNEQKFTFIKKQDGYYKLSLNMLLFFRDKSAYETEVYDSGYYQQNKYYEFVEDDATTGAGHYEYSDYENSRPYTVYKKVFDSIDVNIRCKVYYNTSKNYNGSIKREKS